MYIYTLKGINKYIIIYAYMYIYICYIYILVLQGILKCFRIGRNGEKGIVPLDLFPASLCVIYTCPLSLLNQ